MCVSVKLNDNFVAIIDAEDAERVRNIAGKWALMISRRCYYARTSTVSILGKKQDLFLHSFIMRVEHGQLVDRVNGNGLDNRKSNLRVCTKSQNQHNRTRAQVNNSSGITGVTWNKKYNKWQSAIKLNGKSKHLGVFVDIEDARAARRAAELKHFGDFAPKK